MVNPELKQSRMRIMVSGIRAAPGPTRGGACPLENIAARWGEGGREPAETRRARSSALAEIAGTRLLIPTSRVGEFERIIAALGAGVRFGGLMQHKIDLRSLKANRLEFIVEIDQALQFERQQRAVPAGFQRQLIVGQDIGCLIGLGEMR